MIYNSFTTGNTINQATAAATLFMNIICSCMHYLIRIHLRDTCTIVTKHDFCIIHVFLSCLALVLRQLSCAYWLVLDCQKNMLQALSDTDYKRWLQKLVTCLIATALKLVLKAQIKTSTVYDKKNRFYHVLSL